MSEDDLARVAYEARFKPDDFARGYVKPWSDLPPEAKAVWIAVADAVAGKVYGSCARLIAVMGNPSPIVEEARQLGLLSDPGNAPKA